MKKKGKNFTIIGKKCTESREPGFSHLSTVFFFTCRNIVRTRYWEFVIREIAQSLSKTSFRSFSEGGGRTRKGVGRRVWRKAGNVEISSGTSEETAEGIIELESWGKEVEVEEIGETTWRKGVGRRAWRKAGNVEVTSATSEETEEGMIELESWGKEVKVEEIGETLRWDGKEGVAEESEESVEVHEGVSDTLAALTFELEEK